MSKKISFFIKFALGFLIILSLANADNLLIFPKKKPQLSKEVIEKRVSKNIIKPKSKPKAKIEITLKKEDLKPLKKPKDEEKVVEKTKLRIRTPKITLVRIFIGLLIKILLKSDWIENITHEF